ncbi:MAG: hypothetical protein LBT74_02755 [Acidobacteriota bacterium]|jgi:hypothetical protein|nr:hypothetical protein [Acidobacteriota bacterium]
MLDVLTDSALDVLKTLPAMYLVCFLGEFVSSRDVIFIRRVNSLRGVVATSLLGLIPQCGVSVGFARLYARRLVGRAALLTVFLSGSDEALIVAAGSYDLWFVLKLVVCKVAIAAVFGMLLLLVPHKDAGAADGGYEKKDARLSLWAVAKSSAMSVLKLALFLFVAVSLLELAIETAGMENLGETLQRRGVFQVVLATCIGAVPSCASSVFVTQAYLGGFIGFGALVGGLCANTGYGIIVVFKELPLKKALAVLALLMGVSIASGMVLTLWVG